MKKLEFSSHIDENISIAQIPFTDNLPLIRAMHPLTGNNFLAITQDLSFYYFIEDFDDTQVPYYAKPMPKGEYSFGVSFSKLWRFIYQEPMYLKDYSAYYNRVNRRNYNFQLLHIGNNKLFLNLGKYPVIFD